MKASLPSIAVSFILAVAGLSPAAAHSPDAAPPMLDAFGGTCATTGIMSHGHMGQNWMDGQRRMGATTEDRLAHLKAELDIGADQEDAWDAYETLVKGQMAAMQDMHQSMIATMQNGSMTDRLAVRIAAMEAMVMALKEAQPVTEALYATMSEHQQEMADQLMGAGCGAM